ncbi:IS3 family transposase [Bifidobacterium aquikefiricola]|uniref:IS3 family transposase n=1 Tax=Bifidobacterium aquikefiricola TaxID=3059038 RepID=A0AB39U427_9BIFI
MATTYSDEFKADAVALVRNGMMQRQVRQDLGISKSSPGKWVQDAELAERGLSGTPEERRALKRIRELETENEILRKAAAYLSKANPRPPKMIYPLVRRLAELPEAGRPAIPVVLAGRVLGFSKQAYFTWRADPVSMLEREEKELLAMIRVIHEDDPQFGYRLAGDELHARGVCVSERRVWRICSKYRICSTIQCRYRTGKPASRPASDDLVRRKFHADAANVVWLTDITEHWTSQGKLYLCAVKDVWSNRIVGWSVNSRMRASLAVDALEDAWQRRGKPRDVIIHSDRGSQFGSRTFIETCRATGIHRSMGQAYTCADNAAMESFFSLLQKNVLNQRSSWPDITTLRLAIIRWIEGTYNRRRRQRSLGKLTPVEYETIFANGNRPTA